MKLSSNWFTLLPLSSLFPSLQAGGERCEVWGVRVVINQYNSPWQSALYSQWSDVAGRLPTTGELRRCPVHWTHHSLRPSSYQVCNTHWPQLHTDTGQERSGGWPVSQEQAGAPGGGAGGCGWWWEDLSRESLMRVWDQGTCPGQWQQPPPSSLLPPWHSRQSLHWQAVWYHTVNHLTSLSPLSVH